MQRLRLQQRPRRTIRVVSTGISLWHSNYFGRHGFSSGLLKIVEDDAVIVLTHLIGQQSKKRIGLLFAIGALGIAVEKEICHCTRNGSMLKNLRVSRIFGSRHHRAARNPGRNENGWDANAETVKRKRLASSRGIGRCNLPIRSASRWNDVIIDAAVLVVYDEQNSILPKSRVGA